jgi:hypothetical protein
MSVLENLPLLCGAAAVTPICPGQCEACVMPFLTSAPPQILMLFT